jgi:hypothetical protein
MSSAILCVTLGVNEIIFNIQLPSNYQCGSTINLIDTLVHLHIGCSKFCIHCGIGTFD